jgi:CBS domain-containing protein
MLIQLNKGEITMKLIEIMTREVEIINLDDSIQTAAEKMRFRDIGFLPVYDGEKLIGTLTDRDIVIRVIAEGVDPKKSLSRDWITQPPVSCYADQDVEEAVRLMEEHQIRRLIILSRDEERVAGVVSLGDLATNVGDKKSGEVLQEVSEPT